MMQFQVPEPGPLPSSMQLNKDGKLRHFLTVEGLSAAMLTEIMDVAEGFTAVTAKPVKKVPLLRGKTIFNLFFEPSTRTRISFELAAKRLSADVMNMSASTSSTTKGESLLDTIRNLEAMHSDMFIVRHSQAGAAHLIARHVAPHISVLNAGDGRHAHPTQAMLDVFTIRQQKGSFNHLKVAIVGDILHSRVARSQIHALNTLNVAEIRVVAPRTLLPRNVDELGVHVYNDLKSGLKDADVVIMLRLQKERMSGALLPSENEYYRRFGVTQEMLAHAKPDALVMHPGPTNRGVEIASDVADGPQSVILQQVSNGVAIRMALMAMCMGAFHGEDA